MKLSPEASRTVTGNLEFWALTAATVFEYFVELYFLQQGQHRQQAENRRRAVTSCVGNSGFGVSNLSRAGQARIDPSVAKQSRA